MSALRTHYQNKHQCTPPSAALHTRAPAALQMGPCGSAPGALCAPHPCSQPHGICSPTSQECAATRLTKRLTPPALLLHCGDQASPLLGWDRPNSCHPKTDSLRSSGPQDIIPLGCSGQAEPQSCSTPLGHSAVGDTPKALGTPTPALGSPHQGGALRHAAGDSGHIVWLGRTCSLWKQQLIPFHPPSWPSAVFQAFRRRVAETRAIVSLPLPQPPPSITAQHSATHPAAFPHPLHPTTIPCTQLHLCPSAFTKDLGLTV